MTPTTEQDLVRARLATFYTVFEQLNFAFIADCLLNNSINFASAAAVKINNITWEKNCVLTMNYIYMYRER